MELIAIHTPVLKAGDNLAKILTECGDIRSGDIIVISSKVIATVEGAAIDLSLMKVTDKARVWAQKCGKTPEFRQAVLNEVKRMNGRVLSGCPLAMLTELKPEGLSEGTILAVNAGLDMSNVEDGFAIGWPRNPVQSVARLRRELEKRCRPEPVEGRHRVMVRRAHHDTRCLAVILSDSCCRPRRLGVTAMALTVSGLDPLVSQIGKKDIFGKELTMTHEAVADQLATAANMLMGNIDQRIPAVIIRNHGIPLLREERTGLGEVSAKSETKPNEAGWVKGIELDQDLFRDGL